ncbi:MAG: right-handed parallel beta-helix repeat-containing protein [Pseudomonadota bacterium]
MSARQAFFLVLACLLLGSGPALAQILRVGPGQDLKLPSQAARLAGNDDIVEIEAGDYHGDVAVWRADGLVLRGVGGMARLFAAGAAAQGKGIWVIRGRNTTVEHIAFHDARVPDRNGAGIRFEGSNLTVRHCLFQGNENGILTGGGAQSEILVENSEFTGNGHGDGYSHNIYIGAVARFTLRDSISRLALVGHQVKSRARENYILNNDIADEASGRSSYLVDLPSGGIGVLRNNRLHQGPRAENGTMLAYAAEKLPYPENRLLVEGNVFRNDRANGCRLLFVRPGVEAAQVRNNQFIGCARMDGPIRDMGNTVLPNTDLPMTQPGGGQTTDRPPAGKP